MLQLGRLLGPAQRGERHQRRREPGVEHVLVAAQRSFEAGRPRLRARFLFGARDIAVAGLVVPGRDLMSPPQLARDAPVLDIGQPLVVGADPVFGDQADLAALHGIERDLGDRAAGVEGALGRRLAHRDEPLVGQHRLDHATRALALGRHQLVLLDLGQQALGVEVGDDAAARLETVQADVLRRRVVGDLRVERQHGQLRQLVAQAHRIVVEVMARRDLDHAGTEFAVDVVVGDHRDLAIGQRQFGHLADQVRVALVLGMDHQRDVAQHRFRARGGDRQMGQAGARVRLDQRIADMPERAFLLDALDLQVRHGGAQHRVPVDQPLAPVDQPLLVQPHEHFGDHARHLRVHREIFAAPVDRRAHAPHLPRDGRTRFLLPGPYLLDEGLAAEVVPRDALRVELALDHDLRGDARVVGARHPQRVGAPHARVARQAVHDGLVERVSHVQRAGDVGRRQLDGEIGPVRVEGGLGDAPFFPLGAPFGLDGGGFEALG